MADDTKKAPVAVGPLRFGKGMLSRRFEIDATASGWGKMTGTLRPATAREAREFNRTVADLRAEKAGDDAITKAQAAFFAEHFKTWNVETETEEGSDEFRPVPLNAETLAASPLPFWDNYEIVVLGYQAEPILGNSAGSSGS